MDAGNLRGDEDVVLTATSQNPKSFRFASPALKSDRHFVLRALTRLRDAAVLEEKVLRNWRL